MPCQSWVSIYSTFRYMYCILQIYIPTLINMLFKKYNKLKRELELKVQIVPFEIAFQLAQFWASFSCVRDWNQRTLQVSSEYPCELKFWHCMLISCCSTDWNYTAKEFVQYRVNKIFNSEFADFHLVIFQSSTASSSWATSLLLEGHTSLYHLDRTLMKNL